MKPFIIGEETAQAAAEAGRKAAIQYSVRKYRQLARRARQRTFSIRDASIFVDTCPLCIRYFYSTVKCPLIRRVCNGDCSKLWQNVRSAYWSRSRARFGSACAALASRLNNLLSPKDRV